MNPTFDDIYSLARGVALLVLLAALSGFLLGFCSCYLMSGKKIELPKRPLAPPPQPVREAEPIINYARPIYDTGIAPPPAREEPGEFERLAAIGDAWNEEKQRKHFDEEVPTWAQ